MIDTIFDAVMTTMAFSIALVFAVGAGITLGLGITLILKGFGV